MISRFSCIECKKEYGIREIIYRCVCGGLLEVLSDFDSFSRTEKDWISHFDSGMSKPAFLRYKDILLPELPKKDVITLGEGDTPLYDLPKGVKDYFGLDFLRLKHEGMNPTLSFKDRGMAAGVSWANTLGIKTVACASTGDTSASMAAYASFSGKIRPVVLLPHGKISVEQLSQPISSGAITLGLDTDFDGCMEIVQKLTSSHEIYLLNSMNSIRIEGQKAIGIELMHQLGWQAPDWIILPVGNAGNISALGKGLRELHRLGLISTLPRLAGVESAAADPLYQSYITGWSDLQPKKAKKTVASAIQIGNPVSFKKAVRELIEFNGVMERASEEEILDAKAIVDAAGIPVCPNSATALAGLKKLVSSGVIKKDESVVAIMTAHGAKFSQSIIDYHKGSNKYSNKPLRLPATLAAVKKELRLK